jgi:K+-sensing histidine kinase KdpD
MASSITKVNLSVPELHDLYSIALSSLSALRHDAITPLVVIIEYSRLEMQRLTRDPSALDGDDVNAFLLRNIELARRVKHILNVITIPLQRTDFDLPFEVGPSSVLDTLRELYPSTRIIEDPENEPDLRLLYPGGTFVTILHELVNNVRRHVAEDAEIRVEWRMKGPRFTCSVHDSGSSGLIELSGGFVPLDVIAQSFRLGEGLRLISRIVRVSRGLLLFRKSPRTGGVEVYFEFPVVAYWSRGTLIRVPLNDQ